HPRWLELAEQRRLDGLLPENWTTDYVGAVYRKKERRSHTVMRPAMRSCKNLKSVGDQPASAGARM
ncbi:MAG: hypothetical protein ABIP63_03285, partial [Thermoanaerobaculia bacterium]